MKRTGCMSPRATRLGETLLASVLLALTAAGCPRPCPTTMVPLESLVAEYNANAASVPRLWARARIQLTLTTPSGLGLTVGTVSPLDPPNALLLLSRGANPLGPHNFVLIGRETASLELLRVGSSAEEDVYYLWYGFGDRTRAWWGRNKFAGAPGVAEMPIDPNQLLAVLGVCPLPADFTQPPTVAMTMNATPGQCAYVLTYIDRQPVTRRLTFRREIHFRWDKDEPRRPFLVHFFDAEGRRIMTATLKDYRPIKAAHLPAPPAAASVMPTDIEINWPERKSRVHIVLSEMTTADKWQVEACRFREHLPISMPPDHVVQVDEHLETQGALK